MLPPWPTPPCQFSLTGENATLRLVGYSSRTVPSSIAGTIESTLGNVLIGLAYEQSTQPIAAFTRHNGSFTVDVVPENATVPVISEDQQRLINKTSELLADKVLPGIQRPEVGLYSKLREQALFLAWVKIYYSPTSFLLRKSIDYEIWGNDTAGVLGRISLSLDTDD